MHGKTTIILVLFLFKAYELLPSQPSYSSVTYSFITLTISSSFTKAITASGIAILIAIVPTKLYLLTHYVCHSNSKFLTLWFI